MDEINDFIRNCEEPDEEHRGLMAYYYDDPAIREKVFSAIPSVRDVNGELVGVFECEISGELTVSELEDLRSYLTGQASDGWGEGLEQHGVKTADFGEIYVSFGMTATTGRCRQKKKWDCLRLRNTRKNPAWA